MQYYCCGANEVIWLSEIVLLMVLKVHPFAIVSAFTAYLLALTSVGDFSKDFQYPWPGAEFQERFRV